MKFTIAFLFLIVTFVVAVNSSTEATQKKRYDNYKVFKVTFTTEDQFNFLYNLKMDSSDLDFWQLSRARKSADIMVPPGKIESFVKMLDDQGLSYEVTIEDVQKTFEQNE